MSCGSLRALNSLRRMVDSLSSVISDGISRMEKEVLPASRFYGINSLPSEIISDIMDLVGQELQVYPSRFKKMVRTFSFVPPFNSFVTEEKDLFNLQKMMDWTHIGCLPVPPIPGTPPSITRFCFTKPNNCSLREIRDVLAALTALEFLDIICHFSYHEITKGGDVVPVALLPRLQTLVISNFDQEKDFGIFNPLPLGWKASEPLRRIIRVLDMPNLTRIVAWLFTDETRKLSTKVLDDIFGFPDLIYPHVQSFELEELIIPRPTARAHLDLSKLFRGFPSLTSLSLRSSNLISYRDTDGRLPASALRHLTLHYGDHYGMRKTLMILRDNLPQLLQDTSLSTLEVASSYEEVFEEVRKAFPAARWMTDRSVLDG